MNDALVEQIANAILFEGYLLYPYRPSSVKNRQRWTFGGLFPEAYCAAHSTGDAWAMQTECLVAAGPDARLQATVRFLHLLERGVGELGPKGAVDFRPVGELRVGTQTVRPRQEAVERRIETDALALKVLAEQPHRQPFAFSASRQVEPLHAPDGTLAGVVVRQQQTVEGAVELTAERLAADLYRVAVRIENQTPLPDADRRSRDEAQTHALASTHAILQVDAGKFVSLIDPPESLRTDAAACRNVGVWPVLVGDPGATDAILAAPIILYDYPQIAPESPGDLFDGTEIDEILTLRILTLSDAEKEELIAGDERARLLLNRTEALPHDQLLQLHSTLRGLRPLPGGNTHD